MSPDDPRHGTYGGYWQHRNESSSNPCLPCRVAASRYNTNRKRQIAYGRWSPWVDAEPCRDHVGQLRDSGMSLASIAAAVGVPTRRISHLIYGAGKRRPPAKIRPEYAARVLAVEPTPTRMPAFRVARRIQALLAMGHASRTIAERLGVSVSRVHQLSRDVVPVKHSTLDRVCAVYESLSMVLPDESTGLARKRANHARAAALRNNWLPPLAWDDIDDPNEQPTDWQYRGEAMCNQYAAPGIDPVVVMRLLEGVRVKANKAEKEAAMSQWVADGGSRAELARMHGWKAERYTTQLRLVEEAS